jgi:hypothetical protein
MKLSPDIESQEKDRAANPFGDQTAGAVVQAEPLLGQIARAADEVMKEAAERPRRAPSANTKKAKGDLLRAVAEERLDQVEQALAMGVDPSYRGLRGGGMISPLALACQKGWIDGALALIDAGATESAAHAAHLAEEPTKAPEIAKALWSNWPQHPDLRALKALAQSEPDEFWLGKIADSVTQRNWIEGARWMFEGGMPEGVLAKISAAQIHRVEGAAFDRAERDKAQGRRAAEGAAALGALWGARPDTLLSRAAWRWARAIRSDSVATLAMLAKHEKNAPKEWVMALQKSDFPCADEGHAPISWRGKNNKKPASVDDGMPVATGAPASRDEGREAPTLLAALLVGSPEIARALARAPALLKAALEEPSAKRLLAACPKPASLREAARLGFDLASCVDERGRTPLHAACHARSASRTAISELARLCPAWIGMRDEERREPCDLLAKIDYYSFRDDDCERLVAELQKLAMSKELAAVSKETKKAKKAAGEKPEPAQKAAPKRL